MTAVFKTILLVLCCGLMVQPEKLLADTSDPNEPGVADDRDFNAARVGYHSGGGAIVADVRFYDAVNLGSFWLYISTDNDNVADYMVRCYASYISVREHSQGQVGPEVYRGSPTTSSGTKYSFKFPAKALGLDLDGKNTIRCWFFWIAGGGSSSDRMPDSGDIRVRIP